MQQKKGEFSQKESVSKNLKKTKSSFVLANLLADLLNSIHSNPDGIIISSREVLEVYGISKSSYYRFISFLQRLDFLQIIWVDSNYKKIVLRSDAF